MAEERDDRSDEKKDLLDDLKRRKTAQDRRESLSQRKKEDSVQEAFDKENVRARREKPKGREFGDSLREANEELAEKQYLDTYKVQSGDSLSAIALRYYDSAARDKWMAIYEENKAVIGDNPNLIFPGQELKIPRLE